MVYGHTDSEYPKSHAEGSESQYSDVRSENHKGALAWIVENHNIQHAMLAQLDRLGVVDVFDCTSVEKITRGSDEVDAIVVDNLNDWPALRLDDGRVLRTKLLVGVMFES
jgi:2-polyprenyl-6-methoxyphenol hydroxylase-like FAD-dependent oxidoreductase